MSLGASLHRATLVFFAAMLGSQAGATTPPDSSTQSTFPDRTLFGAFTFDSAFQNVSLSVCGKLAGTNGCFGSASMGPFGHVCAMIQERPGYNLSTNNITRMIYVFDTAAGTSQKQQHLIVYRRTDNITGTVDMVTIKKVKTIPISITNGSLTEKCMMVANSSFIYAAVYTTGGVVRIDKSNYAVTLLAPFSGGQLVSSLTTDTEGFVNATGAGINGLNGWRTYNPDGSSAASGTGSQYLIGTPNSLDTATVPTTDVPFRASQTWSR